MCGIGSIFHYQKSHTSTNLNKWLESINLAHQKRGPDGEGIWVSKDKRLGLAHRRLAVIDPSSFGEQPMATPDGSLKIVFNGEIYNYKELKKSLIKRGYRFFSNSDTEVILNLYQAEGIHSLKKLRGMFAIALWDETKKGLLLARDQLGIKPLYYADDGSTVRAASQVKALLAAGEINTALEPAGHVGFFLFGYVPEPFTMYKGIRALPAGSALWFGKDAKQPQLMFYYNLSDQINKAINNNSNKYENNYHDHLKVALCDSIQHHIVSDVPVGLFLSSGLDSTTIACLACGFMNNPLQTFTLGFTEYQGTQSDEALLAGRIAGWLNCKHSTQWIKRTDFEASLNHLFSVMDQPSIDGANTYFVSKYASEAGLKVALSGVGGDELFGGYPSFHQLPKIVRLTRPLSCIGKSFRLLTAPMIKRFCSPKFAGLFEYGSNFGGAYLLRRGLFMPWELPEILNPDIVKEGWEKLDPVVNLNRQIEPLIDNFHRVFILESLFYMQNQLLRDADWAGMAHSLEIRVPFVDTTLIDSIVPLMPSFKTTGKVSMAHAAWGKVPKELLTRPKTGFSFPIESWGLKGKKITEGGLRAWAQVTYTKFQQEVC